MSPASPPHSPLSSSSSSSPTKVKKLTCRNLFTSSSSSRSATAVGKTRALSIPENYRFCETSSGNNSTLSSTKRGKLTRSMTTAVTSSLPSPFDNCFESNYRIFPSDSPLKTLQLNLDVSVGICSRPSCKFVFCLSCYCEYKPNHICPTPSSPSSSSSEGSPSYYCDEIQHHRSTNRNNNNVGRIKRTVSGTKESKKMLRRL